MRIAFLSQSNPYGTRPFGGAESSQRVLAQNMAARGHDVIYLTTGATVAARAAAAAEGVELIEDGAPDSKLYKFLERHAYSKQIARIMLLTLLLRRRGIDLLYSFYERRTMFAVAVMPRRTRPKIVVRMAGLGWFDLANISAVSRRLYLRAFNRAHLLNYVAPGLEQATADRLNGLGWPALRTSSFVQDIGCAAPVGREVDYPEDRNGPFRIVMASRFSWYQKRQDLLVEALALLPADTDIELTFFGNGMRRDGVRARAEALGLGDKVRFIPFSDQQELWRKLQDFHLMCHAADHEGLSKITVEAMAKGLPVLASDVPGLRGLVHHGKTGFLTENTAEAWAEAIKTAMTSQSNLKRMSDAAMEEVRTKYAPEACCAAYERAFCDLLESGR